MTELYLNDKPVVLTPDVQIALTRQINDVGELQQRQADFTNRFTVSKSANSWLADMLNTTGNGSLKAYKFMKARIVSNGIQIVTDGNAIITETRDKNTQTAVYEITIYAGNYDLFARLKDYKIGEIGWDDLEHTFDLATWFDLVGTNPGYEYPVLQTLSDGKFSEDSSYDVDLRYQFPVVHLNEIWNRIMLFAGLEHYSDFYDSDEWKQCGVVANNNFRDYANDNWSVSAGVADAYEFPTIADNTARRKVLQFNTETADSLNQLDIVAGESVFTAKVSGKLRVKVGYTVHFDVGGLYPYTQKIVIQKNGVDADSFVTIHWGGVGTLDVVDNFSHEFEINVNAGDTLKFIVEEKVETVGTLTGQHITIINNSLEVTYENVIYFGSKINFKYCLPQIGVIDFMKAIMQMFGLVYRLDEEGKFEFETMESVLSGTYGVVNMTDKLLFESSETYRLGKWAKLNDYKYKYSNYALANKKTLNFGDDQLKIDIDDLEAQASAIDSIVNASEDTPFQQANVAKVGGYTVNGTDITLDDNKELFLVKLFSYQNNYYAVKFWDGSTYDTSNVVYYGQFKDYYWTRLNELYYPKMKLIVQKPVKKTVYMWLTPIDMYFLNFFKIIYLEQYQSNFYINKVDNFMAGKATKMELIKVQLPDAPAAVCGTVASLSLATLGEFTVINYAPSIISGYSPASIRFELQIFLAVGPAIPSWMYVTGLTSYTWPYPDSIILDLIRATYGGGVQSLHDKYGTGKHYRIRIQTACTDGSYGEFSDWLEFDY